MLPLPFGHSTESVKEAIVDARLHHYFEAATRL